MTIEPFDRVVTDHGEVVWRVCRALLPAVDADDAWSETFISALRAYPELRPDSNVRGWLVTIAHRKAIDQLRHSGRTPKPHADLPERPSIDGIPEPRDEELWKVLAGLPDKQRAAVVYHHVAGLPYGEVAPLIDSSVAAARRNASDGIARLRDFYLKEKRP